MQNSRLGILTLLQRKPETTIDAMAQSLDLAPATVRRHLDILQRDHLVAHRTLKRRSGRPTYAFSLTEAGEECLPRDYQRLSSQVLRHLAAVSADGVAMKAGQDLPDLVVSRMSREVTERHRDRFNGKPFSHRLTVLVDILKSEHFSPEAERLPNGALIRLYNCPFRKTALEHASVCGYDAGVISAVLGTAAIRRQCIIQGDSLCTYFADDKGGAPSQDINGT